MNAHQVHDLLLARARALGVEAASEEQTIDALLEREIHVPEPTDDECRRWYEAHPERCRGSALVEADHILFALTDRVPLPALREQAQRLLNELLAAPERFAELAREYSNCPSARLGGNLGQFSRRDVAPEFWRAMASAGGVGVLPSLVETRFGLHIVRVNRRIEGELLPYEQLRQGIAAMLAEHNLKRALRDYAQALLRPSDLH